MSATIGPTDITGPEPPRVIINIQSFLSWVSEGQLEKKANLTNICHILIGSKKSAIRIGLSNGIKKITAILIRRR